jgi:hypothetical protein
MARIPRRDAAAYYSACQALADYAACQAFADYNVLTGRLTPVQNPTSFRNRNALKSTSASSKRHTNSHHGLLGQTRESLIRAEGNAQAVWAIVALKLGSVDF